MWNLKVHVLEEEKKEYEKLYDGMAATIIKIRTSCEAAITYKVDFFTVSWKLPSSRVIQFVYDRRNISQKIIIAKMNDENDIIDFLDIKDVYNNIERIRDRILNAIKREKDKYDKFKKINNDTVKTISHDMSEVKKIERISERLPSDDVPSGVPVPEPPNIPDNIFGDDDREKP